MDDPPRRDSLLTLASHGLTLRVGAFLTRRSGWILRRKALRAALHDTVDRRVLAHSVEAPVQNRQFYQDAPISLLVEDILLSNGNDDRMLLN